MIEWIVQHYFEEQDFMTVIVSYDTWTEVAEFAIRQSFPEGWKVRKVVIERVLGGKQNE